MGGFFCESRSIDFDDLEHMCLDVQDVIGAAETGSGKTLAFGLPILQRLLDEQEKIVQKSKNSGKGVGSPLRALIITPTRELALQVAVFDKIRCDQLQEWCCCILNSDGCNEDLIVVNLKQVLRLLNHQALMCTHKNELIKNILSFHRKSSAFNS